MPNRPPRYRGPTYKQHERLRGTTAERGYGGRWRRLRAMVLRRQPLCGDPSCNQPSAQVHHRDGNTDNNKMCSICDGSGKVITEYGESLAGVTRQQESCPICHGSGFPNLQGLCHRHHSMTTRKGHDGETV